jgi:hypothetical protein
MGVTPWFTQRPDATNLTPMTSMGEADVICGADVVSGSAVATMAGDD